jgi:hypothetical protein
MSTDNWYWLNIQAKKKGNLNLYKDVLVELFGEELKWSEVKSLSQDKQAEILWRLEDKIRKNKSPYDIKKLARAIQQSRSGIGGCAITNFTCAFCGKEESWSNTSVPEICIDCATRMAEKFVFYGFDILKDGVIKQ